MTTAAPLVRASGLVKVYASGRASVGSRRGHDIRALDGIDLEVRRNETLGLVGESGSGKSTAGRLLLALERPDAGTVRYGGRDLAEMTGAQLRSFRRSAQVVFQDPDASLNPRLTVGSMLREILAVHDLARGPEAERRVREILALVGLGADAADRYPHEFSGGQRQRVGIARALTPEPEFIVLDEPVSALDVSVQAQILNLLVDLQARLGLTYLFISHDLGVVRHIADRVAVMRAGKIVETGSTPELFSGPQHEYTRQLLAAVPRIP